MGRLALVEPSAEELESRRREGSSPPNLQRAVAHAPEVARLQFELNRAAAAGMPLRQKELIILLVGLRTDNAYCWGHHVPPARASGISDTEMRSIREGDLSVFSPSERALLTYCEAMVARRVTDDIWNEVTAGRTPEEIVKITMLVGFYCMLGAVQGALQIEQDPGFGGFEAP